MEKSNRSLKATYNAKQLNSKNVVINSIVSMKIIVTGGAGFVGSHLVDQLVQQGHEVAIIDHWKKEKKRFVPEGVMVKKVGVESEEAYEFVQAFKPEAIIHLAAQISVPHSTQEPLHDAKQNILGTINMLKAGEDAGVRRFINTSTCGVYGDVKELPLQESSDTKPKSPYALSKKTGEEYGHYFDGRSKMNIVSVRPANLYGPRQQTVGEAGVIAIFMERAIRGEDLMVFGDGSATRDWLFVSDIVEAYIQLLHNEHISGVLNLGTGVEKTVQQLCHAIEDAHGAKLNIVYKEERPGDIHKSYLNIDRAKEEMDWQPKITFEEGILKTYQWFKEQEG